jgi:hypothetical protein
MPLFQAHAVHDETLDFTLKALPAHGRVRTARQRRGAPVMEFEQIVRLFMSGRAVLTGRGVFPRES